jgi:enamine deaminase RidA (YjgF/YER057c/UK114 family)
MSRRHWNPAGVAAPAGRYVNAVLVERPERVLTLSGLLGIRPDGTIPASLEGQAAIVLAAIDAALAGAGMDRSQLVRLVTYLVEPGDRPRFMRLRDAWAPDPPPASTLVVVKALALPACLIEIEATAAA